MTPGADEERAAYDEEYYRSTYGSGLERRLPRLTREQYWARWLRRRVDRSRPVVDLGAGLGWLAQCVRGQGITAVTIDISEFSARRLGAEQLDVIVGSATRLPLGDRTVGAVVALDVLEHVDDVEAALAEIRRVVTEHGYVVLSVPNVDGSGARAKRGRGTWFGDRDVTHTSLLEPDTWVANVLAAGFSVVRRGSDFWWDVPYPVAVPEAVQRAVLLPLHRGLARAVGAPSWSRGENLVLVGQAS